MARVTLNVTLEERPDGGLRVYSDELPGLILSGPVAAKVIRDIEPAARVLMRLPDAAELIVNATLTKIASPLQNAD